MNFARCSGRVVHDIVGSGVCWAQVFVVAGDISFPLFLAPAFDRLTALSSRTMMTIITAVSASVIVLCVIAVQSPPRGSDSGPSICSTTTNIRDQKREGLLLMMISMMISMMMMTMMVIVTSSRM